MNVDELGRAAAAEARRAAADGVDSVRMLDQLHRRSRNRTAGAIAAAAAILVAIVVSAVVLHDKPSTRVAGRPTLVTSPPAQGCGGPLVHCPNPGTFVVSLPAPLTVRTPANFEQGVKPCGTAGVEAFRNDSDGTGVTVIERAVPVRYDRSWSRDPAAGTTAASMAQWLAARPFLIRTSVKPVTLDGISGWQVSADLKPGARVPAPKGFGPVAPTFAIEGCTAGYRSNLSGNYTLLDVPGGGVTVIWSWTIEPNHSLIAGNQAFIAALRFG